jgi:hypothetical protein
MGKNEEPFSIGFEESTGMEESLMKIKAAAAMLQNMVSTEEEVRYNDLALFYIAKLLYEGIGELEGLSAELKNDKRKEQGL